MRKSIQNKKANKIEGKINSVVELRRREWREERVGCGMADS